MIGSGFFFGMLLISIQAFGFERANDRVQSYCKAFGVINYSKNFIVSKVFYQA